MNGNIGTPARQALVSSSCALAPTEQVAEAAVAASRAGLCIIPPAEDGSKRPLPRSGGNWKRYQESRPTPDEIGRWFPGRRGLGVVCGRVSGNLVAIDFDDPTTFEAFRVAVDRAGLRSLRDRIEGGYLERTPKGGAHWLYRLPDAFDPPGCEKLAERPLPGNKRQTLIETKAEGGFVVLAPSGGPIHPSGKPYTLESGGFETIETITPGEQDELYRLARTFDETADPWSGPIEAIPERSATGNGHHDQVAEAKGDWIEPPGKDFDERTKIGDLLDATGWRKLHSNSKGTYWTRPDKERGVSAVSNESKNLVYCWSSSTKLPTGKGIGPAAFYCHWHHGGNWKETVKALHKLGFGKAKPREANRKQGQRKGPNPEANGVAATNGSHPANGSIANGHGAGGRISAFVFGDKPTGGHQLTDMGNAERFIDGHGEDCRFCYTWQSWLVFDGKRWIPDAAAAAEARAKATARAIYHEAAEAGDLEEAKAIAKWAASSQRKDRLQAMLWVARSDLAIEPEDLDANPWLLNVDNGTVDLRTGDLLPHNRADLLTFLNPIQYDPDATCPRWESFLIRIFERDFKVIDYIRRLAGYCLTGVIAEQVLPIAYGKGANGKSTLFAVLQGILGPYAMKAPSDLLMMRRPSHPTELADLAGKRLVVAVETGEDGKLNETLVKELTGGDRIRARRMRENFWEFEPTHKVLLATNHRPKVKGTDHAIWRRLQLIPFNVAIPRDEQDPSILAKFKREYPGILAWAVRGCLEWRRDGLNPPANVALETERYRASQDIIGDFLGEHCVTGSPDFKVKSAVLYAAYRTFMEASGEQPRNHAAFGEAMTERGFERYTNNGTWYRGIGLRQPE